MHEYEIEGPATSQTRRNWLASIISAGTLSGAGIGNAVFVRAIAQQTDQAIVEDHLVSPAMVESAAWIAGIELKAEECLEVAGRLNRKIQSMRQLRRLDIDDDTPTPSAFVPSFFLPDQEIKAASSNAIIDVDWLRKDLSLSKPESVEDVAFWSIQRLGMGLRRGWFTSVQLTQMFLKRLAAFDPLLQCVVSFNRNAIEEAHKADQWLSDEKDLGPLHGIPWGAKDIIAVPGMPTTWGTARYRERFRDQTATVAERMNEAGAVLLAKLSVGTLAMGDQWFGGMTRNPWNPQEGSSGSSAGSACAVAAGLCGFAIGSETLGSIVSPTRRCLTNGLRPSFGRVSRAGCMTLAWSMDKIGPIARSPEDCGMVFSKMIGSDGKDPTVVERDFVWPVDDWGSQKLRVGLLPQSNFAERLVVETLKQQGAEVVPLDFPSAPPLAAMLCALDVEATAMHDRLFASAEDEKELGRWGPTFRAAQFITGVDYVRSMRARVSLIRETENELQKVDVLVGDGDLARMNLTGHPTLVISVGSNTALDRPYSVALTGRYFSEATLIGVGTMLQNLIPPLPHAPQLPVPE